VRIFATLAQPGSYLGGGAPVVGRLVANTELVRALLRHGGFERLLFFAGEGADREAVLAAVPEREHARVGIRNLLELPGALARGELDVLHHHTHVEQYFDLVWLRDRYARGPLPVTAQIHSLSYPRMMQGYLRGLLSPPGEGDALFCSSTAGRQVVEGCFAAAAAALGQPARGALRCALPVVPLAVDCERLTAGDRGERRAAVRARLGVDAQAVVLLGLGRFTEYDKMDLFPLLQVFQRLHARAAGGGQAVHLVLAGGRQGTKTPEMLELWAQALGVAGAVSLVVDFAEDEKPDLLAAADLFVSPVDNVQETFGISVIEAMAAGLPPVVSDFDGYKDTVDVEVGVRVPTRAWFDDSVLPELGALLYERPLHLLLGQSVAVDLGELEAALAALIADEGRRRELGRRAAARARARYDWRVVIPQYERVWRELAGRRRGVAGAAAPALAPTPPLAMRHAEIFAHYPTALLADGERLVVSALGRSVHEGALSYVIYPELRNVFTADDVVASLAAASRGGITAGELRAQLEARWSGPDRWRAGALVIWLLKHGMVEVRAGR
jgi:glycosyltransferase involved in cell wall biosynthesis